MKTYREYMKEHPKENYFLCGCGRDDQTDTLIIITEPYAVCRIRGAEYNPLPSFGIVRRIYEECRVGCAEGCPRFDECKFIDDPFKLIEELELVKWVE